MAIISGTAGNVTPSRFGLRPTLIAAYENTWMHGSFGGVTYRSPRTWRDTDRLDTEGYDIDTKVFIMDDTVEGGDVGAAWDMDIDVNSGNNFGKYSWSVDKGSGRLSEYVDDDTGDEAISGAALSGNIQSTWDDSEQTIQGHSDTFRIHKIEATETDANQLELRAVFYDYQHADESRFDGGDTDFELTGLHPVSAGTYDWTPFDENESCNAFAAMSLVCDNTNRVVRETRPAWTVPIYDDNSTAIT